MLADGPAHERALDQAAEAVWCVGRAYRDRDPEDTDRYCREAAEAAVYTYRDVVSESLCADCAERLAPWRPWWRWLLGGGR